jgi:hypothetical protein
LTKTEHEHILLLVAGDGAGVKTELKKVEEGG